MLLSALALSTADRADSNADTYAWLGEKAPVLVGFLFTIVVVIWLVRAVRWLFSKDVNKDSGGSPQA